ncbi:MAG: chromosome segregation protein SMC [Acidobacteria bacterium]|nr:chromosome segregation protein SMC [Acidobacteriota bacterium]
MFLKSLVVRGFKSFADKTALEFTPGVAVIVGPNGSGKSNLVDAIAWVLGEQGPKTLRGGKMEDVIFAGTPGRPALGRAEVTLTIDNSAGILPIEFTEVTISRTLFRSGESEYAINGVPSRLLDVQELLSDSGIGRELHTIVGQGQLDAILNGRPEERRAAIEEAAGILKHRKRKERALRKLERVDADVERLGDVIGELRRQIRPLEQQAEVAKRADAIEAELGEVRLKLWVIDYRALASGTDAEAERAAVEEAERLARAAAEIESRAEDLEARIESARGEVDAARATEYRLGSLLERYRGLSRLAEERARRLEDLARREPQGGAPEPGEIEAARRAAEEAAALRAGAEDDARRAEAEWRAVAAAREEAARAREEIVHLSGERAALRGGVEAAVGERTRIEESRAALGRAGADAESEAAAVRSEIERLDGQETSLVRRVEEVEAHEATERERASAAETSLRSLERDLGSIEARRAALAEELEREGDPASALEGAAGVLGRLADHLEIRDGYQAAVRAALEPYAEALLATSRGDAVAALDRLKEAGARAALVVCAAGAEPAPLPDGARSVLDVATPTGPAAEALRRMLGRVALAGSLAEAAAISRAGPGVVAVTREGDRVGPEAVIGGAPVVVRDVRAEIRGLDASIREKAGSVDSARRAGDHARAAAEVLARETRALREELDEMDARLTGAADRLARIERDRHAAEREDAVLAGRWREIGERILGDEGRLRAVEAQLGTAVAAEPAVDGATLAEIERRAADRALRLGEVAERERAAVARVRELEESARRAAEERARWEAGREARLAGVARASAVGAAARRGSERLEEWIREARSASEERRGAWEALDGELTCARRERREAEAAATEARERAHESDLRRAERLHRIRALEERLREEHGLSPAEALEAVSVDVDPEDLGRRATGLERRLALLGRVNRIAMDQYQGLVDRHAFLQEQVADLKRSRRDLLQVVEEVDAKVREVFSLAFDDVAREFAGTFGRLFPGGEGRLVLTDPENLLETGVEVEARPAGKRVKRISLLSGGERALTAVALLYAIFRARPSPFYLLDEVEAALDDINLHRFLEITREFRERSQILVVTHQKRTMEIADALYGISMGKDGVTRVICERLDGREDVRPAPPRA